MKKINNTVKILPWILVILFLLYSCDLNYKVFAGILGESDNAKPTPAESEPAPGPPPPLQSFNMELRLSAVYSELDHLDSNRFIDHYNIIASAPNQETVRQDQQNTLCVFTDLAAADWDITVQAISFNSELLGETTHRISLVQDSSAELQVTLAPNTAIPIKVINNAFTISWEKPDGDSPASYNIFYRKQNTSSWTSAGSVLHSAALEYTQDITEMTSGIYEIGLTSVYSQEKESDPHTSTDSTALPGTGWLIYIE